MKYEHIAQLYEKLNQTTKRLEKTHLLASFLQHVEPHDVDAAVLLVEGRVFPVHDARKIGVAEKLVVKAVLRASGVAQERFNSIWRKEGDIGSAAERVLHTNRQATFAHESLSVKKVLHNLQKLAEVKGKGSVDKKSDLLVELLTRAQPIEAKYIVRTCLEHMRVGIGEGTFRDAIVWAFFGNEAGIAYEENSFTVDDRETYQYYVDAVQRAYDLTTDFVEVVKRITHDGGVKALEEISLEPGRPVKVMLFLKVDTIKAAFESTGTPAAVEYKYDGFRVLIHKNKETVRLFTRRLEDVTVQFPDVVDIIQHQVQLDTAILDGEIAGYDPKTGRHVAFQQMSHRIKRKYDINEMMSKHPVEIIVFDVLFANGTTYTDEPYTKRRNLLGKTIRSAKHRIRLSLQIVTDSEDEAAAFYQDALAAGFEGVMVKNISSIYKPGSRVGFGVKLKPTLEPLQAVVIGAEWGSGKRSKWLSSFTLALLHNNTYVSIGKVGTGLKDKPEEGLSFPEMTTMLQPLITSEDGKTVRVKPHVVIEVDYEEIQASPSYESGYALRFPRVVRLRDDLGPEDVNTLDDLKRFYAQQRGRDKA